MKYERVNYFKILNCVVVAKGLYETKQLYFILKNVCCSLINEKSDLK